jgi:hypothetical protein
MMSRNGKTATSLKQSKEVCSVETQTDSLQRNRILFMDIEVAQTDLP